MSFLDDMNRRRRLDEREELKSVAWRSGWSDFMTGNDRQTLAEREIQEAYDKGYAAAKRTHPRESEAG